MQLIDVKSTDIKHLQWLTGERTDGKADMAKIDDKHSRRASQGSQLLLSAAVFI